MDTPQDRLSQQTVTERPPRPIVQRTISVRLNLRVLAALGAGLIVLGAFLPWIDPTAQAALGTSRLAQVIQGWPSLLIGLIALGVLALPHADSSGWVSLPAAALGLAAAFTAAISAIATANVVAEVVLRFPHTADALVSVTGAGVFATIAGGIVCVVAGLSRPPTPSTDARLDLRPGQPAFAIVTAAFVVVALVAGLIGAWIESGRSGRPGENNPAAFQTDLLSTPVIDVGVTPLGVTVELTSEAVPTEPLAPTEPPPPTPTSRPNSAPTLPPSPTIAVTSPLFGSPTPTATERTFTGGPGGSPTPTATSGSSPPTTPTP